MCPLNFPATPCGDASQERQFLLPLLRVLYLQEVDENPLCKYPSSLSPTRYLLVSAYAPLCYFSLCFAERIPEGGGRRKWGCQAAE